MKQPWGEALSRFADGDDVDVAVLAEALESREGRDWLVDVARLRRAVRDDSAKPDPAFYAQAAVAVRPAMARRAGGVSYRMAAALALAAGLLGLGADVWWQQRIDSPPRPTRVLQFDASEWTPVNR